MRSEDIERIRRLHEVWLVGSDGDAEDAANDIMETIPALLSERARADKAEAELAEAKQTMKVQASAVKNLQAAEHTEINVLRKGATDAHRAVATLDSERAMNAMLTEENERLQAELARVREAAQDVKWYGGMVMEMLEEHGPSIVPHLIDTDDNAGEHFRDALRRLARAVGEQDHAE